MCLKSVKSPEELMEYLNKNLRYGVIDDNGNKLYNSDSKAFQQTCNHQWKLRSVEQILKDGVGHCYDQVEIEREWFEENGYEIKTFWISAYQEEIENSGFCHTYLIYKKNDNWKLFEHSDYYNRGIYIFKTIQEAVKWQADKQIKMAASRKKPKTQYLTCIKEFKRPPISINMKEYLEFIDKSEDYII